MAQEDFDADVCLILEGTYPYLTGGVSNWTHELISAHPDISFYLLCIVPPNAKLKIKFELPGNIKGIKNVFLQSLPKGQESIPSSYAKALFEELEKDLLNFNTDSKLIIFSKLVKLFADSKYKLGANILMDSELAWNMLINMYHKSMNDTSFIDYFWTWRVLLGGLYSILLCDLPKAKVYHSLCTGYAGLLLARAKILTSKPCILTEHGIYTNERRVEIASAEWLEDEKSHNLSINKNLYNKDLKDFWIDSFVIYSKECYEAADEIITLYAGNHQMQIIDGASVEKLKVIPNGIDFARYSKIHRKKWAEPPVIALIGRVVPIKDIKTFIRSCELIKEKLPELKCYIIGPTDEDKEYYKECLSLVDRMQLNQTVEFVGKVITETYLSKIDLLILTSISESQPLVILEAGAAGIPSVATDVGACSEIIFGDTIEEKLEGTGGVICRLSNPTAVAAAAIELLTNEGYYNKCSKTIKERVKRKYNIKDQNQAYEKIYRKYMSLGNNDIKNNRKKIA